MSATINWERLARAEVHPLRLSILEALAGDSGYALSATDLTHELQAPMGNVDYHLSQLARKGIVEEVRSQKVRGATERFYALAGEDS